MKISIISLGCPKNLYDTERLLGRLGENGFILTDSIDESDFVILNTCAFIKDAVDESKDYIKKLKDKKLIVWGCLAQREKEKLLKYNQVLGVIGTGNPEEVLNVLKNFKKEKILKISENTFITDKEFPRLITTFPYAYIKISEGCENFCSYCLIPNLRGPLRSRKIEDILKEAEEIEKMGFKEIIIIAQDTTNYGKDLNYKTDIKKLLDEIEKLNFEWIRIMYMHPAHIKDDIIEKIGESKKICKYFDIPLQHISSKILEKMNRPIMDYRNLINKIRKNIPESAIRTTFIIGFPGETEDDFKKLIDFICEMELDRVGFFKYSREEGTKAYNFQDQIDEKKKQERLNKIIQIQKKISEKRLKRFVGRKLKVLVEKKENEYFIGRTEYDAPEIDGIVYIKRENLKIGKFYNLKITSSSSYDLFSLV